MLTGRAVADDTPPGAVANVCGPRLAAVYDYWVGGKDSRLTDREVAGEVLRHRPQVLVTAQANRAFGQRVTTYAAHGCGIRQFLDIGTGLPTPGATHQTAQQVSRDCRVVYADNDPLVLAHARALLTPAPGGACDYIEADICDPAALLAAAAATLDFSEPVAVLLLAILHFIPDEEDPAGIVGELAAALAPGSLIAISHVTADYAPGPVTAAITAYNQRMPVPVHARDHGEVTALLGGLPVLWPGVVPVSRWRPMIRQIPGRPVDMYGAMARLPDPGSDFAGTLASEFAQLPLVRGQEPAALTARAAQYPGHQFSTETVRDRTRYVARGVSLASRPYAVITGSPDELFAELAAAQPSQPPPAMAKEPRDVPPRPGSAAPSQTGGKR
jgi:hypothetical protein